MRAWSSASGWTRDAHLVDSQRGRDRYEAARHGAAEESERLLQARPRDRGHGGVTANRAQRMAENGEALRYIELVLRQLRRASRDHRRLVQQRHADFRCDVGGGSRSRYKDTIERGSFTQRDSREPWQSDMSPREVVARSADCPQPDVTTRLLTKRRDYGGTAHSTAGILRAAPGRVQDGITAAAYQDLRYVPGWEGAQETFGAWSLPPEAPPGNDRGTSSTLV